jgi:hypothetical protein
MKNIQTESLIEAQIMASHTRFSLRANLVFVGIAFIQRNPSFLMEDVEAVHEVAVVVTENDGVRCIIRTTKINI